MKWSELKIIVSVLNFLPLIGFSASVIRNDVTDRCIHMDSDETPIVVEKGQGRVYASRCSWESRTETDAVASTSNPNQWMEIVATTGEPSFHGKVQPYIIRKVAKSDEECLSSNYTAYPGISHECTSPNSTFSIDLVDRYTFGGSIASLTSFKIRNRQGHCLTVKPGTTYLYFKECSPRAGLFQVWSVCRHTKQCDVELTWSPRDISFPTNVTSQLDKGNATNNNVNRDNFHSSKYTGNAEPVVRGQQGIVNEPLYTIQNALGIYDNSEDLIRDVLSAFYPPYNLKESVKMVLEICENEQLRCRPCSQNVLEAETEFVAGWLVKWMTECNTRVSEKQQIFLSRDVLQVPQHLFPKQGGDSDDSIPGGRGKLAKLISTVKAFLHQLESLDHRSDNKERQEYANSTPLPFISSTESGAKMTTVVSDSTEAVWWTGDKGHMGGNQTDDILALLDVRLNTGKTPNGTKNASPRQ